jgi:hypothetical protein
MACVPCLRELRSPTAIPRVLYPPLLLAVTRDCQGAHHLPRPSSSASKAAEADQAGAAECSHVFLCVNGMRRFFFICYRQLLLHCAVFTPSTRIGDAILQAEEEI